MNSRSRSSGLDVLIVAILIVTFAFWLLGLPPDVQKIAINKTVFFSTLLIAQPGLIGGVRLMFRDDFPAPRRYWLGGVVVIVAGIVIPMMVGGFVASKLDF